MVQKSQYNPQFQKNVMLHGSRKNSFEHTVVEINTVGQTPTATAAMREWGHTMWNGVPTSNLKSSSQSRLESCQ